MPDFCAHCGEPLPPPQREAKKYRHESDMGHKEINAALCVKCKKNLTEREGYKQVNKE
jgi:hypothetical protein